MQDLLEICQCDNPTIDIVDNVARSLLDAKYLFNFQSIDKQVESILEARTIERKMKYLKSLYLALTEKEETKSSNININKWKDYDDIWTDSLWIIPKKITDTKINSSNGFHGAFVPQIPNQLIRRYTRTGDWVLDTFAGSGTSLVEARALKRNSLGIELNADTFHDLNKLLYQTRSGSGFEPWTILSDCVEFDYDAWMKKMKGRKIDNFQLAILHPPYHDIIKFSDNDKDLSRMDYDDFLLAMWFLIQKLKTVQKSGSYLALIIGDKYFNKELIDIPSDISQTITSYGYQLKAKIVKNFNGTIGKRQQEQLWRYRALRGEYYIFKHEYIYIFQRK